MILLSKENLVNREFTIEISLYKWRLALVIISDLIQIPPHKYIFQNRVSRNILYRLPFCRIIFYTIPLGMCRIRLEYYSDFTKI
ncbi:MAG: hypothetical protein BAJALOKI3v1_240042 [Promethearchaeota archaeon]|nr:MAG: hypothetical protein BAJALOKI3v1_240042 [Candidatus Lokiarchaeota archaeon]